MNGPTEWGRSLAHDFPKTPDSRMDAYFVWSAFLHDKFICLQLMLWKRPEISSSQLLMNVCFQQKEYDGLSLGIDFMNGSSNQNLILPVHLTIGNRDFFVVVYEIKLRYLKFLSCLAKYCRVTRHPSLEEP